MKYRSITLFAALALATTAIGCKEDKPEDLAPKSQELEADEPKEAAEAPDSMARSFEVDTAASKVTFQMDAELEKISGKAPESVEGSLTIDLADLSKTTGLFKIDLMDLSIYQQKREDPAGEFSELEKNETQNEHMRTWLQISEDGPAEQRKKNRWVEFKLEKVAPKAKADVTSLEGSERSVDVDVTGKLRLHGRVTEHTFPATATFRFDGDEPKSVVVTSKEPIGVSLEKHDVRPRKAFDVLADKTLAAMGAKVAKVAEVSLELHADVAESATEASPAEADADANADADADAEADAAAE